MAINIKKENKCKFLLIIMGCSLILSIINLSGNHLINEEKTGRINRTDLKVAASDITIITPENRTYTEPMSGYYPATYGFENDEIGTDPEEFVLYETGGTIEVIEELDGHRNIVDLYDTSGGTDRVYINNEFNETHGTIEYWVRTDNVNKTSTFLLVGDGGTPPYVDFMQLFIEDGNWKHRPSTANLIIPNVATPQNNTWHRITIHFRCVGAPAYKGLAVKSWKVIVDGVDSGQLGARASERTQVIKTQWQSVDAYTDYHTYVDALGYSWDPNYNIGDNLNEGLLLSYNNNTNLDWTGYSLDGQPNVTILGNTTIPMNYGSHSIQVFGNDSIGTNYESDIRYFLAPGINLITPESKTYTEPMSGYYPATFGFEDEDDGTSNPRAFNNIIYASCDSQVISEIDNHKKVLRAYDNNGGGAAIIRQKFNEAGFQNQTYGTVEYYFRVSSTGYNTEFRINWGYGIDDAAIVMRIEGASGNWQASNVSWYQIPYIASSSANTWYHIKIHFRCEGAISYQGLGENKFELLIDGVSSGELPFSANSSEIAMIQPIYTAMGIYDGNYAYIDAIGYSWDTLYNIGDNMNEGLLLSYDNYTTLNWTCYSLDGQNNITIFGNTTIPMNDGSHSIQVFGNYSLGINYKSEMRYFSAHRINLITPERKTYTEPMSGYYPATYGFESDVPGGDAKNWNHDVVGGTHSYIVDSYKGHDRVYELWDNVVGNPDTRTNYNNQSYGTIEFWVLVKILPNYVMFVDFKQGNILVARLKLVTGDYLYADNGSTPVSLTEFGNIQEDQWYHIRVDFRSALAGQYMGLADDSYVVYLNGIKCNKDLLLKVQSTRLNSLQFTTGNSIGDPNYFAYFDAVGYSWDPYYNIGDNMNEGLLLSFENSTNIDFNWTGYSYNGQNDVAITGNTTIPMPEQGGYTIQVFGNDSLGTVYSSEIRPFYVGSILSLKSPEPLTYTEPMSGYYPATFGFENIQNGIPDPNFSGGGSWEVIEEYDGHQKVLEGTGFYQPWDEEKDYGTVEYYVASSDTDGDFVQLHLGSSSGYPCQLSLGGSNLFGINDGAWTPYQSASSNTWYHVRIDFEASTSGYMGLAQYDFFAYIDGTRYGPFNFSINEKPNRWTMWSNDYPTDLHFDAIGYLWDPNYNIGDNLNEGLLLSFDNFTNLDWMGYSINGQTNITILGNTTIPIPIDGDYTIQVFARDRFGTSFTSTLISFTIDMVPNISEEVDDDDDKDNGVPDNFNLIFIFILVFFGVTIAVASGAGIVYYRLKAERKPRRSEELPSSSKADKHPTDDFDKYLLKEKADEVKVARPVVKQEGVVPKEPKKPKKLKKPKKAAAGAAAVTALTKADKKEIAETEAEMGIEEQKFTCIVHKGPIEAANIYLCPQCKTFYCTKCAAILKEKGEKCWSCEKEIEIESGHMLSPGQQLQLKKLESKMDSLKTTSKNLDESFYAEAIQEEEYNTMKKSLTEKIKILNKEIEELKGLK